MLAPFAQRFRGLGIPRQRTLIESYERNENGVRMFGHVRQYGLSHALDSSGLALGGRAVLSRLAQWIRFSLRGMEMNALGSVRGDLRLRVRL